MYMKEIGYYMSNFIVTCFAVCCGMAIGHHLTVKEENAKAIRAGAAHWTTGEDGAPKLEYIRFKSNYDLK
jgi:hypothetical protein